MRSRYVTLEKFGGERAGRQSRFQALEQLHGLPRSMSIHHLEIGHAQISLERPGIPCSQRGTTFSFVPFFFPLSFG